MDGWWDRIKHHSLGWVGIRLAGRLAGRNRSLTVALPPQYMTRPSTLELWFTLAE
ncbi:hypothetical protein GCM10010361_11670 [Streptomyces olivaceiscleroticus]|uniref:Uncharacterized protein n=1 Tax=Streptomyces olivaceiscleroticus TaxID=68245 RepID=A0ABP3JCW0_9ACTN